MKFTKFSSWVRPLTLAVILIGLESYSLLSNAKFGGVNADDIEESTHRADEFSNLVTFTSPL